MNIHESLNEEQMQAATAWFHAQLRAAYRGGFVMGFLAAITGAVLYNFFR